MADVTNRQKNNKNFSREDFAETLYKPNGKPQPRENKSQQAQLTSKHKHGIRKDKKTKMENKLN